MESLIAKLLSDFEQGKMNRRQLIQSLAMASAASAATASAATGTSLGLKAVSVNHISYQVTDYTKTRDWYKDVLGMGISHDDGQQCYMTFGNGSWLLPRNKRAPGEGGGGRGLGRGPATGPDGQPLPPRQPVTGLVNHVAYTLETWNAAEVKAKLESYGLKPRVDTENSFHVTDPDGYDVQISGKEMKP